MAQKKKEYDRRKLQVLRYASKSKSGISPRDLNRDLGIKHGRQLLYRFRNEELFTHPKRGKYRISKRGRERLAFLEEREDISKTTGVDIGLNYKKDSRLPIPIYEIRRRYRELKGQGNLPPSSPPSQR